MFGVQSPPTSPMIQSQMHLELAKRLVRTSPLMFVLALMYGALLNYEGIGLTWHYAALVGVAAVSLARQHFCHRLQAIAEQNSFASWRQSGFGDLPRIISALSLVLMGLWGGVLGAVCWGLDFTGPLALITFALIMGFSVGAAVAFAPAVRLAAAIQFVGLIPLAVLALIKASIGGEGELYGLAFMCFVQFVFTLNFTRISGKDLLSSFEYAESLRLTTKELAKAEHELVLERERAFNAEKLSSLGRMAGGVAHEINNPLTIAIGSLNQVKRQIEQAGDLIEDRDIIARRISRMEVSLQRVARIVSSMMVLSRSKNSYSPQKVLLGRLVEEVVIAKDPSRHGIDFEFVRPENDVAVLCQEGPVIQVIESLLSNAIEAVSAESLKERKIRISVQGNAGEASVWIEDSGTGVLVENEAKLFEPFFSTKPVGKGVGLGLAVGRTLALAQGGDLEYLSGRAKTTFVLRLPRAEASSETRPKRLAKVS